MDRRRRRPAQEELVGVIPPVLPIWLLAGLPPDLPGAPHGWPPTADDSVRRATPLDPAAAAAAAATTPDEAGRSGSSRTCHLRSNHRAHHPVLQADPWLDHATAAASRPGRAVDLAGAGCLRPAALGPRGRRRPAAAVGGAATPAATVALSGTPRVSAAVVRTRLAGCHAETLRMFPGPKGRPSGPAVRYPAIKKPAKAQEEATHDRRGRLTSPAPSITADLGRRPARHARRVKSQA
jgi:hypothetical protein